MLNAYQVSGMLAEDEVDGGIASFQPRAIRKAMNALIESGAKVCGHRGPWFAKAGDPDVMCPWCMSNTDTWDRWLREKNCTGCGEDASTAPLWLLAVDAGLLVALRLCVVCSVDVTEVDLETEIRK